MSTASNTPPAAEVHRSYLYRVGAAGRYLGFGPTRTRELIKEGSLKAVRVGSVIRVPGWAIEEFVLGLPLVEPDGARCQA